MALLPYVDESTAPEKTREILGNTPRKLNVARMMANASEAVFHNFSRLGNALLTKGKLEPKLREIAILRTAKVSGSVYEWTQHVGIGNGRHRVMLGFVLFYQVPKDVKVILFTRG